MPVTIKDIARQAGVSHATVSRALNGHSVIPERTASTIREIAAELGYLPSAAARGLKTNRSRVIGVIVSRIDNPYFGEVVQGIEDALQEGGYSIFVASSHLDFDMEKSIVQAFSEHRVDGVIIGSVSIDHEHTDLLKKYGIPIVVINNQLPRDFNYAISHDDIYGGGEITRLLLDLGHRRIGYLGNALAERINRDRYQGMQQAFNNAGLSLDENLVVHMPGSEIEHGEEGMRTLLARDPQPSAVFCFNDLMAIGALKELRQRGMRVPEDISVAGFDNISYSAYTTPTITTFDQPKRQIGSEAAAMLLELLGAAGGDNGQSPRASRLIRGQLLIRESTSHYPTKEPV